MTTQEFELSDIGLTADLLLKQAANTCICFYGEMGAGKTTFIKAMLTSLGAVDTGNSPTFGLVNEYHDTHGKLLAYHFDFYRIENEEEVYDMGFEEYLESGAYVFIEWPERIPNLLPEDAVEIQLEVVNEYTRRIGFTYNDFSSEGTK